MSRFVVALRWLWRHLYVLLLPITWGALTALIYWLTPIAPAQRFQLHSTAMELGQYQPGDRIPSFVIVRTSADGRIVVTAEKPFLAMMRSRQGPLYYGPVRVWDVQEGKLLTEIATKDDSVTNLEVSANGSWLSMDRNGATEINRIVDGKKSTFAEKYERLCHSNSGRWVAYRNENALELFDPGDETVQTIFAHSPGDFNSFESSVIRGRLHAFSDDDRWLAIQCWLQTGREGSLVLLDVDEGCIVARFHIESSIDNLKIARDKKTLAFTSGWELVVMDIEKDERLVVIKDAKLLGWDEWQKNVIVFRQGEPWREDGELSRLETWSLTRGKREREWAIPKAPLQSKYAYLNFGRHLERNQIWDNGLPALSPNGSLIVWAGYHQTETPVNSDFPGAICLSDRHYNLRVLNTLDFTDVGQWRIDVAWAAPSEVPMMKWSPVDNRLFFSDHHQVEIWNVPPRSLSQSAGVAMVLTWLVAALAFVVQRWFTRKRNKITEFYT
jgi:hypothetical protein